VKRKAASVPYEDILLADLKDTEEAAAYLEAAMSDSDSAVFLLALRQVATARGMADVARKAHVGRESLYKTLSGKGNPEFRTLNRLLQAMGMRLSVSAGSRDERPGR
jgi:probable addiction module antidote protein